MVCCICVIYFITCTVCFCTLSYNNIALMFVVYHTTQNKVYIYSYILLSLATAEVVATTTFDEASRDKITTLIIPGFQRSHVSFQIRVIYKVPLFRPLEPLPNDPKTSHRKYTLRAAVVSGFPSRWRSLVTELSGLWNHHSRLIGLTVCSRMTNKHMYR